MLNPSAGHDNDVLRAINGDIGFGNNLPANREIYPAFSLVSTAEMEVHAGTEEDPYILVLD